MRVQCVCCVCVRFLCISAVLSNPTVKNHTLISMTLNFSNPNRVKTSKVKHSLNKQEKITILDKLKWNRAMTTIMQTSDMTNDTKTVNSKVNRTRRLQIQNDTPHLSSLNRLKRPRDRTEASTGLNITLRADKINMTPPPIIQMIDRLVSKEPSSRRRNTSDPIKDKATIRPDIGVIR